MSLINILKAGIIIFTGLLLIASTAQGQPIQNRVLENVTIEEEEEVVVIRVGFSFPVRYISHFPPYSGKELRIQLEPIAVSQSDRDAIYKREAIKPTSHEKKGILEVLYEGDIAGGLYLTLFFDETTSYRVKQGKNYRSLVVIKHEIEPTENSGDN